MKNNKKCLTKPFFVPCGMTDGEKIVSYNEARRIEDHRCPSCFSLLETDPEKEAFKHKGMVFGCTTNTVLHRIAINLLQQKFYRWKNKRGKEIKYEFICRECGESSGEKNFSSHLGGAFPDFPIDNSKGQWAVDIALLDKDNAEFMQAAIFRSYANIKKKEAYADITKAQKRIEPFAVIEIRQSIPMLDKLKKGIMLPWMELQAESVIANPYLLEVIDTSFKWHECLGIVG